MLLDIYFATAVNFTAVKCNNMTPYSDCWIHDFDGVSDYGGYVMK